MLDFSHSLRTTQISIVLSGDCSLSPGQFKCCQAHPQPLRHTLNICIPTTSSAKTSEMSQCPRGEASKTVEGNTTNVEKWVITSRKKKNFKPDGEMYTGKTLTLKRKFISSNLIQKASNVVCSIYFPTLKWSNECAIISLMKLESNLNSLQGAIRKEGMNY